MRLPKELTIAGHSVKIKYRKKLFLDNHECWGLYDSEKNIIYLRLGMESTQKMEIVIHEAIHSISDIHLLNLSEKAVKILGIEILGLIRNNKLNLLRGSKK